MADAGQPDCLDARAIAKPTQQLVVECIHWSLCGVLFLGEGINGSRYMVGMESQIDRAHFFEAAQQAAPKRSTEPAQLRSPLRPVPNAAAYGLRPRNCCVLPLSVTVYVGAKAAKPGANPQSTPVNTPSKNANPTTVQFRSISSMRGNVSGNRPFPISGPVPPGQCRGLRHSRSAPGFPESSVAAV